MARRLAVTAGALDALVARPPMASVLVRPLAGVFGAPAAVTGQALVRRQTIKNDNPF
jgi:hypothetical protein